MAVERLQTQRLLLRPVEQRDAPLYFSRISSREAVARTMLWAAHREEAETSAAVQRMVSRYADPGYCRWVIALREDDTIIGVAELLRFDMQNRSCSFAYMIGEDYWNRGYASEALRAVFTYGFAVLGLERIEADHFSDNPASGRVMQKLGMVHCGRIEGKYEKDGIFHDAECYCVSKADFFGAIRE